MARKILQISIFFVAFSCCAPITLAEVLPQSEIDRIAKPAVEGGWLHGLVVGLIDAQGTQVTGYGSTTEVAGAIPNGRSVFEIGSISKTFTATLLADDVVHNEVALNDPVQNYLPPGVSMPLSPGGKTITLLNLTTHSSGLPRMPGNFHPVDPLDPYADYTVQNMYDGLAALKLTREPGESCEYSNLGVGLLGNILAHRAGKNYDKLLQEKICHRLHMISTRTLVDDDMRHRLARPFDADGNLMQNWSLPGFAGAGGINSTADDMLLYLSAELGFVKSDLSPAIELTHQRQREFSKGTDVALGWFIDKKDGYYWHNGQTGAYHSFAGFDLQKHVGVVVLSNSPGGIPGTIGKHLLRRLLHNTVEPLPLRKEINLDPATLNRYVGEYQLSPLAKFVVKRVDDHLTAQLGHQLAYRISPESDSKFFYKVVDAQLTFIKGTDGRISSLVLHQNGQDLRAEKAAVGESK